MSDKLHLRLTLDVTYDRHGVPPKVLIDKLYAIVHNAMGDGWVTGDTAAEVDTHQTEVIQVIKG